MELPLRSQQGESMGSVEVRDDVFCAPSNQALVHQVVVGQLANKRVGTASTKNRARVSGGGRKPRPQKGMGAARQGSIRSPHYKGGGVVFGPEPRSYHQRTPRRMRRQALVASLSDKVRNDELIVVDEISVGAPKTSHMATVLEALDVGPNAILVADGSDAGILKSARNIPDLRMLPASLLNALDLVSHRKVVMTLDAVRRAETLWSGVAKESSRGRRSAAQEEAGPR
jgi:large subunit ribosomal protein L4